MSAKEYTALVAILVEAVRESSPSSILAEAMMAADREDSVDGEATAGVNGEPVITQPKLGGDFVVLDADGNVTDRNVEDKESSDIGIAEPAVLSASWHPLSAEEHTSLKAMFRVTLTLLNFFEELQTCCGTQLPTDSLVMLLDCLDETVEYAHDFNDHRSARAILRDPSDPDGKLPDMIQQEVQDSILILGLILTLILILTLVVYIYLNKNRMPRSLKILNTGPN